MLTLYFAPGTCSRASLIALEESGLPFEAKRVDTANGEQRSEAYLKINPKGRVPALATEKGVLTETPAILAYIAAIAPAAGLAPLDDPFEFARMEAFNSYICSTVHVNHAHGRRASRWADDVAAHEAMKAKVPQTMAESFALIEDGMFAGPWVMGEGYSVADPYLFVMTGWLPSDDVDPVRFPKVANHYARMLERPAVQRALAREKA
ncbi:MULTISPECIES: glutathione S-transferase family protein [unclassified Rhizobium]|uniref:glutathione S-transferase family protein n=1 Tax=unclassified Rhizobium TaxID=2613769 RepID=UPI001ADC75C7|nr:MULTISPECIES: glutathione S-transferase [unclassified Rhizobium]MBO9123083.1 glutathione S-transferase [Rhizobium sp. 16-488-2b]MBO9173615.1 glutathione S-transferase [Rhizobium sp. 16-488-2a]